MLDTRRSADGITGESIADLVLQILSYVMQVGRANAHQRQWEGIKEAKARGIQFGRPRIPIPKEYEKVADAVRKKKISLREGGTLLGVNYTTLRNWMKDQEDQEKITKLTKSEEKC